MQAAVSGRHVLEVACGHGRWSIFAADAAAQVVATDNSPRLLAAARQIAEHKGVPAERLLYLEADAFGLDTVPGEYNGAVVMNFFQAYPVCVPCRFPERSAPKTSAGCSCFYGSQSTSAQRAFSRSRERQIPMKCGHDLTVPPTRSLTMSSALIRCAAYSRIGLPTLSLKQTMPGGGLLILWQSKANNWQDE